MMQIMAYKAILVQRISKQGCEDYENAFAQIRALKPNLNVQLDSICAKVLIFHTLFF